MTYYKLLCTTNNLYVHEYSIKHVICLFVYTVTMFMADCIMIVILMQVL